MSTPIHLRPKRRPPGHLHSGTKTLPKPAEMRTPHEQRRHELFDLHNGTIPLKDIFVDRVNGVELFRNPQTNGWCYRAETIKGGN
jgi:hypothetical protein